MVRAEKALAELSTEFSSWMDSECERLEPACIPLKLVDQHVDAVRAIHREYSCSDAKALAATLTKRLRTVADEFLIGENRGRPDVLKQIKGPSIAPE